MYSCDSSCSWLVLMPHAVGWFLYNGVLKAVVTSRPWVAHACPFSTHVASHSFPRCLVHIIFIVFCLSSACHRISVRYLAIVCCRSSRICLCLVSPLRLFHCSLLLLSHNLLVCICCHIRRSFTSLCSVPLICLMCCSSVFCFVTFALILHATGCSININVIDSIPVIPLTPRYYWSWWIFKE